MGIFVIKLFLDGPNCILCSVRTTKKKKASQQRFFKRHLMPCYVLIAMPIRIKKT